MKQFRRTLTITDIDWNAVFSAYEGKYSSFNARIDGAIPQAEFDENYDTIRRRLGACYVYDNDNKFGRLTYRDEILSALGIYLGYEEDE